VLQILGRSREERSINQIAHLLRLDAAVPQQMFDAGIHCHDRVEDARLRIGVELEQDSLRAHCGER
jgi:hypothetical protein